MLALSAYTLPDMGSGYGPQQILRLFNHLHRAFVAGDRAELRTLGKPLLKHLHLLRPSEVAMALNHFAHAKVLDSDLWQPISDALPDLFVDPDCKALGLAANAYGRALLKHDIALQAIAASTLELCAQGLFARGPEEVRNIAMLVNGYSKLRVRNTLLMDTLAQQLIMRSGDLNEIDLATVANGYARLALPSESMFDSLRHPTLQAMGKFSTQNLAMLANAHARLQRCDTELLGQVATELRRRCKEGTPVPGNFLPSIVHAFVVRLQFCPQDLVYVIEFSLPQVVGTMGRSDVVLVVPSLVNVNGLCATHSFRKPVFEHCLTMLDQLTCNAILGILEAAARLRHDCANFWEVTLQHCGKSISSGSSWESRYIGLLSLLIAEIVATAPAATGASLEHWPPFSDAVKQSIFQAIAKGSRRIIDTFDLRSLADLAVATTMAGVHSMTEFEFLWQRATVVLDGLGPLESRDDVRQEAFHARRLLGARAHIETWM